MTKLVSSGAGHNGLNMIDPGAEGNGYKEAEVAKIINKKVVNLAKIADTSDSAGVSVIQNLNNITAKINKQADGYALSHHLNSFRDKNATGVEVLYGDIKDKPIAEKLSKAISGALGIRNRGAKDGTWLHLATNSSYGKRVLLIEWAFISNSNDMKALMKNMDKAIEAMLAVFGIKKTTNTPSKKKSNSEIAKEVKLGRWGNGQERVNRLTKAGYNAKAIQKLVDSTSTTAPKPKPKPAMKGSNLANSGYYKCPSNMNVRTGPGKEYAIVASYNKGQGFYYDKKVKGTDYIWLSYVSYSGARRYVAVV